MNDRDGAESPDSRDDDAGEDPEETGQHVAGPVSSSSGRADTAPGVDDTSPTMNDSSSVGDDDPQAPADTTGDDRSGEQEQPLAGQGTESSPDMSGAASPSDSEPAVGTTSLDDPADDLVRPEASIATEAVEVDPDEIDPSELTVPVRSLHPRVQILWILRAAITATIIGALVAVADAFIIGFGPEIAVATGAVVLVLGVIHALLSYRIWRYEVREDALYLRRGVLTQVRTVVPFVRIQHVDTSRSPVERLVGLSTSVVYTAGSRGADVNIPGLEADRAEDLQARLKRLAIASEGDDAV